MSSTPNAIPSKRLQPHRPMVLDLLSPQTHRSRQSKENFLPSVRSMVFLAWYLDLKALSLRFWVLLLGDFTVARPYFFCCCMWRDNPVMINLNLFDIPLKPYASIAVWIDRYSLLIHSFYPVLLFGLCNIHALSFLLHYLSVNCHSFHCSFIELNPIEILIPLKWLEHFRYKHCEFFFYICVKP